MPQNLSDQFVCPSPKVLDFNEKKVSLGVRSPCLNAMHIVVEIKTSRMSNFMKWLVSADKKWVPIIFKGVFIFILMSNAPEVPRDIRDLSK